MGNQQGVSAYNTWDINAYSQLTGLSPDQIQQLYTTFQQQAAVTGGRMTINQFKSVYASVVGVTWNFDTEAERIFLMFDTNNTGTLSFEEFLLAYFLLQRSINPAQRWSYAVNSYSLNQPGYLSAQEAQLVLNNMQQFYNFPAQESYFNTAWSQLGGNVNGSVPASSFVQTLVPLIPEAQIW
ncbi:hypothetical protein I4U23_020735 [Adineta vaga]|nr:hypothetical protein I4U23_020735 [Adineta vaga]